MATVEEKITELSKRLIRLETRLTDILDSLALEKLTKNTILRDRIRVEAFSILMSDNITRGNAYNKDTLCQESLKWADTYMSVLSNRPLT